AAPRKDPKAACLFLHKDLTSYWIVSRRDLESDRTVLHKNSASAPTVPHKDSESGPIVSHKSSGSGLRLFPPEDFLFAQVCRIVCKIPYFHPAVPRNTYKILPYLSPPV